MKILFQVKLNILMQFKKLFKNSDLLNGFNFVWMSYDWKHQQLHGFSGWL